jgi:hypothetical protein
MKNQISGMEQKSSQIEKEKTFFFLSSEEQMFLCLSIVRQIF